MGKRGNGEGSIFFVEGRGWRAEIIVGRKPDGKLDRRSKTCELKGDAKRWLDQQNENTRKGIAVAPAKLTVAMHADSWLREIVAVKDQPNTFEYYEGPTRLHIIPAIGKVRLNDLRPDHIRKMLNDKREMNSRLGKPYSRRSIKAIHETISTMLESAVRDGLLERNVAKLVKTNDGKAVREEHAQFVPLNAEQSAHLLRSIENSKWRTFIIVSMMSGLRRGEVVALRWQDVDLTGGWISVRNEIQRVRVKRLKVQPTKRFSGAGSRMAALKTGSKSRRDIEISPLVLDALVQQAELQRAQRTKAGGRWNEQDFVFASTYGDNFHPDTTTSVFAELRAAAGLPASIHLHSLRHAFASAQLAAAVHPKLVQEQLGHSRIATTMDKYSHFMPGVRSVIPSTMEAFIADGHKVLAARSAAEEAAQRDVAELEKMFRQDGEGKAGR